MTTFYPGELADIYLYVKDANGVAFDPTTVDSLDILDPSRTSILEAAITTGWENPAPGTYVYTYQTPLTPIYPYIIARWKYTSDGYEDYEEVRINLKGA